MQFTSLALSALSVGSALAITVHVVKVGNANGTLAYSPNSITAAKGDMVQFQFAPANHTVTQSNFDNPCQPLSMHSDTVGIYSGFMPVSASAASTPVYTIKINDTSPIWIYCSQGNHCQSGMAMVININTTANASRSLEAFQALAAKATVNLPGNIVANGTAGTTSSNSTSSDSGSGSASGTSSSSPSSSTSSFVATAFRPSAALFVGALLALGLAVFV